jgi:hypothetical protein
MYGARSGTMVPDKVPRKVMGGGFRSHSPPRGSLAATGVGISPGSRNEDLSTPRSSGGGKGSGSKWLGKPSNAASSKSKLILAQEQEAAEIEREYIKNLQQQVYYLELELKFTKDKPRHAQQPQQQPQQSQSDEAPSSSPQQQRQQQQQQHTIGASHEYAHKETEPSPSSTQQGGQAWGPGPGDAAPNYPPTPASIRSYGGPAPTTPYAAVAAVREAAERACEELQRTRQQQMDEAASRAYDITTRHLQDHIVLLETAARRMAAAVDTYVSKYDELTVQYRVAQADIGNLRLSARPSVRLSTVCLQCASDRLPVSLLGRVESPACLPRCTKSACVRLCRH